jgi:hypothetical protein
MMELLIVFDSGSEEPWHAVSKSAMVLEIATVLLGVAVGAIAVLYAAPKGYLGHRKKAATASAPPTIDTYVQTTEQVPEVPATEAPAVVEPAPSPAPEPAPAFEMTYAQAPAPEPEPTPLPVPEPAFYETVQPPPAPVTYVAPSTTSFGAPTLTKKPTRTYRRRTAPVRSAAGSKKTLKPRKR